MRKEINNRRKGLIRQKIKQKKRIFCRQSKGFDVINFFDYFPNY